MNKTYALQLHYNVVVGVQGEKCVIMDRVIYMRPLFKISTRPLSQVFTYVNKCPTHNHLVWDISQCI